MGQTLYIEKPLAEALGWNPETGTDRCIIAPQRLEPRFFAITPTDTDLVCVSCLFDIQLLKDVHSNVRVEDLLARATVESSRNPRVQQVLSYLKQSDMEP